MTNKMYLIAVLLLIGTYSLFGQKPTEEDPNVMWTYKDASFSTYPAILPNGNVLVGDGNKGDVIEINGQTGQLVRRITLPAPTSSLILSKDGTRMAASGYIMDVETGAVIKAHPRAAAVRFLNPSNAKIIYTLFNQKDTSWVVWDMENDTYKNYQIPYLVTTIDVSSDGRFLAVASKETSLPINDQRIHFYLYDAQSMEIIRELENVPAEGGEIKFVQFSENAKYVGYGNFSAQPNGTFFLCEPPYTQKKFPFLVNGIGFVGDEFAFTSYSNGNGIKVSFLWDIQKDTWVYKTNDYYSSLPKYNNKYNSIILSGFVSLNINKILNSVSVDEPNEPIQKFITEYRKGLLKISGIESISLIINLTISDTLGNIVFNNQVQTMNGRIELAVPLPSGVYILQIREGNNNYSQKFIVTE